MKNFAKSYLSILTAMLCALLFMPSCNSDDAESSTDDHCFISAFSIGSVKRLMHTTNSSGADSTYYITFSGTLFPMTIDQKRQTIENSDSMPYETRTIAALATVTYTGGSLYYRSTSSASADYTEYSSSDSIDFSSPVDFQVTPSSGTTQRHYTVRLNVHRQEGSKFTWSQRNFTEELDGLTDREMVVYHDSLIMMATTATGELRCARRLVTTDTDWTIEGVSGAGAADIHTLCICQDTLMMSTATGALIASTDGTTWTVREAPQTGLRLLGASTSRIYALLNGNIVSKTDTDSVWTKEELDDASSFLPDGNARLNDFLLDNGTERLVLTGRCSQTGDDGGVVWSKTWNLWNKEMGPSWMYYPHTVDNPWTLPQMSPLFVMPYDDGLIAMGGKTADGKYAALDSIFYSIDYGLTWKTKDELYTSAELKATEGPLAIAVDPNNFIWVAVGKQTWRGRLNRLGFANKK